MHNYYAFGLCFKEKRKDQLNSKAWKQCLDKPEFSDMKKPIIGENPNLQLNENTLHKLDMLEEISKVELKKQLKNNALKGLATGAAGGAAIGLTTGTPLGLPVGVKIGALAGGGLSYLGTKAYQKIKYNKTG